MKCPYFLLVGSHLFVSSVFTKHSGLLGEHIDYSATNQVFALLFTKRVGFKRRWQRFQINSYVHTSIIQSSFITFRIINIIWYFNCLLRQSYNHWIVEYQIEVLLPTLPMHHHIFYYLTYILMKLNCYELNHKPINWLW